MIDELPPRAYANAPALKDVTRKQRLHLIMLILLRSGQLMLPVPQPRDRREGSGRMSGPVNLSAKCGLPDRDTNAPMFVGAGGPVVSA